MTRTYSLANLPRHPVGRAVSVGTFDGVHVGHQRILRQLKAAATKAGLAATVVTFEPHPLAILRPEAAPLQLTTISEKAELIHALGIDDIVALPFTPELATMSALAFAQEILANSLGARVICEGWNFRFGRGGEGTPEFLAEVGTKLGFTVEVVQPVHIGNKIVSSTFVREWLATGDLDAVWQALGHPFRLQGLVERGDGRGRELGFPTANVALEAGLALPAAGVYAVAVRRVGFQGERWRPGMANLGKRPTFGGGDLRLEVNVLDGWHDLYGQALEVSFLALLRQEQTFENVSALVRQLETDRERALAVWAKRSSYVGDIYSPLPL